MTAFFLAKEPIYRDSFAMSEGQIENKEYGVKGDKKDYCTNAYKWADRKSKKGIVNVYKLITKATIEEKIVELQEKKHELVDMVLGGENISRASFSREELLELLI